MQFDLDTMLQTKRHGLYDDRTLYHVATPALYLIDGKWHLFAQACGRPAYGGVRQTKAGMLLRACLSWQPAWWPSRQCGVLGGGGSVRGPRGVLELGAQSIGPNQ